MSTMHLTRANEQKLEYLSSRTGRSRDDLLNEAVERLQPPSEPKAALKDWKAALRGIEGMWADRDDLDEFYAQIRREANRVEPPDTPL